MLVYQFTRQVKKYSHFNMKICMKSIEILGTRVKTYITLQIVCESCLPLSSYNLTYVGFFLFVFVFFQTNTEQ